MVFGLILLLAGPGLAAEVKVKGVGIAPITKDAASAQRVSLVLAKRDAVERALGAVVRAEAVPADELVRVTAATSGTLKFTILSEGVEGKVYVTEIEALVQIPPDLEAKYPRSVEEEGTGYSPLVQKFPHGELDWEQGYLLARGTAKKKGNDPKSLAEARRAAQVDAYGLALQMVAGINLDPNQTVQDRMKKAPEIEYRLQGLIRGAEVMEEASLDDSVYQVVVKVPLRGIKGVQRAFSDTDLKGPPPSPPRAAEGEYTGIVVDARGLGLKPAIFPEIVDEKGEPVYTQTMVASSALSMRGAAAYVTAPGGSEGGKSGAYVPPGRFLVIPGLAVVPEPQPPLLDSLEGPWAKVQEILNLVGSSGLLAQAKKTTAALRQGQRPLQPKATGSAGPTRSRIVISSEDAAKVKQAREKNDFLSQARVVVITDSMIGGTEGKYRQPGKFTLSW